MKERIRRERKSGPLKYEKPGTDEIAKLATRYIIDGHDAREVSERFGIDLAWCRSIARKFPQPESDPRYGGPLPERPAGGTA